MAAETVIPRLQWPKPVFKAKRAITAEEHAAIIQREQNSECRDFYELLWHTGAAQSDGACLRAEDINWDERTICFARKKLKSRGTNLKPTLFRFSAEIEALLKRRPAAGPLFPYLCTVRAGDRATEFNQRCDGLGISGVSLHCYRYAWAERALKCGFPERFAQQALGHNSKAVHRAYAKHAEVTVPSLADFPKNKGKISPLTSDCLSPFFAPDSDLLRQPDREFGPLANGTHHRDPPPMRLDHGLDQA
jgi:integrase